MMRGLRTELRQNICSVRFLISCALLLGLFFMGTGVPDTDIYGAAPCSILKMLLKTDARVWMQSPCFSSAEIWRNGICVLNLGAFLPLIVSFPLLPLFTDELKTQNYRFHCVRSSYSGYVLSKCFAGILTACLTAALCAVTFWLICSALLPAPSAYRGTAEAQLYSTEIPWGGMVQRTVLLMAASAADAMFGMLLAALTADKFASLSLPVALAFTASQIAQKMYIKQEHDPRWFCISPNYLYQPEMWFPAFTTRISTWAVLLIPLLLSAGCVLLTYLTAKGRMAQ